MTVQLFVQLIILLILPIDTLNTTILKQQEYPPQSSQVNFYLLGLLAGAVATFVWVSKQLVVSKILFLIKILDKPPNQSLFHRKN